MNSQELRQAFLNYFARQGHTIVSSSPLIPANDPTLLFTNAGMVQFKDVFLGKESRSYTRAASAQRCVRAGGKHNDLENVGYTARHHTFFEMLGNFSFGDYFKREAIHLAWNFLTQELKLPKEKLWITVFRDDDEAAQIWLEEIQIDANRLSRCGEQDNFWSMGETGPCGPCSEIFYDHGPGIPGGPPGSEEQEGDRYIEIWNLVFMQFNRTADGVLTPLPKPSVDTGMGLERMAAVLQGVHSNYDIDTFRQLIQSIADIGALEDLTHTSLKVIADHIRSAAFLITDGVHPSNEGRGYVLRRIVRRAIRHGYKLGLSQPFFYRLVAPLVHIMAEAYPELLKSQSTVEKLLKLEEEQFAITLDQGMKLLERALGQFSDHTIPGEFIFRLYDTYGFPPDLTADIARERQFVLDYAGFEIHMSKQRQQSQANAQFGLSPTESVELSGETEFIGYEHLSAESAVTALIQQDTLVTCLTQGQKGAVILDRTPFYAESGGQIGDNGHLYFEQGVFRVVDTQKRGLVYWHLGQVDSGVLQVGDTVSAEVDAARHAIMRNHSATHLLHAALRRILGAHVVQKGSLVAADRLRFDFAHVASLTTEELKAVEKLVNEQICANLPCHIQFMSAEAAKHSGAMALFEEKYGDEVRVLSMGEFSVELCGGTHVARTGDIGLFKILHESGVASGVRRIEGVTGIGALEWIEQNFEQLNTIAELLKASREEIIPKLNQLLEHQRSQDKLINQLKLQGLQAQLGAIQSRIIQNEIHLITEELPAADSETLRHAVDSLKQRFPRSVVVLAGLDQNRVQLVVGVTPQLTAHIKANELVKFLAEQLKGKGGGRADLAQGGGDCCQDLGLVFASIEAWILNRL